MKQKTLKKRNPIAFDLFTNGLYRSKVVKDKRKILKKFTKNDAYKEIDRHIRLSKNICAFNF